MEEKIRAECKNDLSEIERVSQIVSQFGQHHHLPSRVLFEANLALEEIMTNVISHGYDDNEEHHIIIRLYLQQGDLTLEVEDDGRPFNPLEIPPPDIEGLLEHRPATGLGIHLVRSLMDGLEYQRRGDKNLLVMRKRAMGS